MRMLRNVEKYIGMFPIRQKYIAIIRYHSFYPRHTGGNYHQFMMKMINIYYTFEHL